MKKVIFILLLLTAKPAISQTAVSVAGGLSIWPNHDFRGADLPVGSTLQFKFDWPGMSKAYRYVEFGIDAFQFRYRDNLGGFSYGVFRLHTGWRTYTKDGYGFYAELGLGMMAQVAVSDSRGSSEEQVSDALFGLSIGPGLGYATRLFCIGIQAPIHANVEGELLFIPNIHLGLHLVPNKKQSD